MIVIVVVMMIRLWADDCRIKILRMFIGVYGGKCYSPEALIIPLLVNDLLYRSSSFGTNVHRHMQTHTVY